MIQKLHVVYALVVYIARSISYGMGELVSIANSKKIKNEVDNEAELTQFIHKQKGVS